MAKYRILALCVMFLFSWVLWTQEEASQAGLLTADEKVWHRMAAYDSKLACVSDASTRAEALADILRAAYTSSKYRADKGRKVEVQQVGEDYLAVQSTFVGGRLDGLRVWTFYQCWPNTVDPRR